MGNPGVTAFCHVTWKISKMNKTIILTLNCIVGAITTVLLYGLFVFVAISRSGDVCALMGVAWFIVIPLCSFFGGWITGYLSSKLVTTYKGCLIITPGIYLGIPIFVNVGALAIMWMFISFAGVWVGTKKIKINKI